MNEASLSYGAFQEDLVHHETHLVLLILNSYEQ